MTELINIFKKGGIKLLFNKFPLWHRKTISHHFPHECTIKTSSKLTYLPMVLQCNLRLV